MFKRLLIALCAPLVLVVAAATPAHADSPHFNNASAQLSGANLTVNFKEAGLGTNQVIAYVANADASATFVCVNKGGGNPSAGNKTTVQGPVTKTGDFSSGKNGSVTASLTLSPPASGGFSCSPGQKLQTAQVSYTNVSVTDSTNGVSASISGTFSTGCLLPDVRDACG